MNSDSILIVARSHLPMVFNLMVLAAVLFFASFIWAMLPDRFRLLNQWGRNLLRQAPSIMTALGLFGTFYGLTESLRNFGIEIEQIQIFVGELKSVFVYSILGIGSAAIFMMLNVVVNAIHHYRAQFEKHQIIQQNKQQNRTAQRHNDEILQYLAAQVNATHHLSRILENQPINRENVSGSVNVTAQTTLSAETQQILQKQAEFAPHLAELGHIQETLTKTVSKVLIPYTNHQTEFHEQLLHTLHENMNAQTKLLAQISQQLSVQVQHNQELIQQLKQQNTQVERASVEAVKVSSKQTASPLDPFKQLEQELAELSHENKKFANKFTK